MRIKRYTSNYPFAATASLMAALVVVFAVLLVVIALYKDVTGVACTGLFGAKQSCADVFQIGVDLVYYLWVLLIGRIIVLSIPLLLFIELVRHFVTKLKR